LSGLAPQEYFHFSNSAKRLPVESLKVI
jgi:hypothetical protein